MYYFKTNQLNAHELQNVYEVCSFFNF